MEKRLKKLDDKFLELYQQQGLGNYYQYLTPKNIGEEKDKFFQSIKKNEAYNPRFSYEKINTEKNIDEWKSLKVMFLEVEDEFVKDIYLQKIDELILLNKLLEKRGQDISKLSIDLFGEPNEDILKLANSLAKLKFEENRRLDVGEAVKKLQELVDVNGYDLTVEQGKMSSTALFLKSDGKVVLDSDTIFSEGQIRSLFRHEVLGHYRRYLNGKKSLNIFSIGLKGYEELEEGLAVNEEVKINRVAPLASAAKKWLAVYHGMRKDFYETFTTLCDYVSEEEAFKLTLRAKRGTSGNKGVFTKDHSYLTGFLKLQEVDDRDLSFGKFGYDHISCLKKVRKVWEFHKKHH